MRRISPLLYFSPVTAVTLVTSLCLPSLRSAFTSVIVLIIACGPGRVAAEAAARGAAATGVGLAPGMVALSRRLHPGVAFHEGVSKPCRSATAWSVCASTPPS